MWFPKLSLLFYITFTLFSVFQTPAFSFKQTYIVYLGSHAHGPHVTEAQLDAVTSSHYELLGSYMGSTEKARESIIYSYKREINGFAALLEEEEAAEIAKNPNVVSVFKSQGKKLHTTRSWDFMLLEKNGVIHPKSLWNQARFGQDIIIATLDTGVWPESKSFSDEGYGPIPSRWKGFCENDTSVGVPCNRKLIGARFFNKGFIADGGSPNASMSTARDHEGHGTHTLSTAGGNFVPGANVYGVANGTAKGGSPLARVAAYKVCWPPLADNNECHDADILEGFDAAIHDGVDVLSVSLGGNPVDYFSDSMAIGSFHAIKKGIVVVCSAGNSGTSGSVTNVAPWIMTVGASALDRGFQNFVELQNGQRLKGVALSKPMPEARLYPLITGSEAKAAASNATAALLCEAGSLDPEKVKGKILVCLRGETARIDKGRQAALAGAAGMILCNDKADGDQIVDDPHFLPAIHLTYNDGLAVFAYINSTNEPSAYITGTTEVVNLTPAPYMAPFSSMGPNSVTPEILKPDVTAPGVEILAAFSEDANPTELDFDNRRIAFNFLSGTSMACPHVSGVVGLLKTLHPDWSPAAIRSAIMTTARTRDNTVHPMLSVNEVIAEATPFSYGSGHIRPNRAADPGLIYDLSINDYLDFLCASSYNETTIGQFSDGPYKCPETANLLDLNYPSITVPKLSGSVTVTRKVKNVGLAGTYAARVREPYGISVSVEPNVLVFEEVGEEKSFRVTMEAKWGGAAKEYKFGGLTWTDGSHYVRSPIVVAAAQPQMLGN